MRRTRFFCHLLALSWFVFLPADANTQTRASQITGSICGRVTMGSKPAPGITVIVGEANKTQGHPPYDLPEAVSVTDSEGKYLLTDLRAGSFEVKPFALGNVSLDEHSMIDLDRAHPARLVNLSDGEDVCGIDFSLSRGGVITGRITTEDGRPLIEKHVKLKPVGSQTTLNLFPPQYSQTDDRGIYRIYGVPPGTYTVSAGELGEPHSSSLFGARNLPRTFYPGVTSESQATPIEVSAGEEISGIDFSVGHPVKTFKVSGKIIASDSGNPVEGITVILHRLAQSGAAPGFSGFVRSDANGEFSTDGVLPGNYELITDPPKNVPVYGDPLPLQVVDADIAGMVVKVQRGNSSIGGMVVLEGTSDPVILAKMQKLNLLASIRRPETSFDASQSASISGEGFFQFSGLPSGHVSIEPDNFHQEDGIFLQRLEIGGVACPNDIQLSDDENLTGVKVVLSYGTGSIQGEIRSKEGPLPAEVQCSITARTREAWGDGETDPRGHFRIDGLPPGDYEVFVNPYVLLQTGDSKGGKQLKEVVQRVSVNVGQVTQVIITIDLSAPEEEKHQ